MDHPTLFDDQAKTRPDAQKGQKVVYEDEPSKDQGTQEKDDRTSEAVAAAVLAALEDEGKRETLRARYARLLWKAAHRYVTVETRSGKKKALEALTDKEAADLLRCEKTTINARRNELMGGMPQYEACPVVVEAGSRKSHVRPTEHENTTYKINPLIVDVAESTSDE